MHWKLNKLAIFNAQTMPLIKLALRWQLYKFHLQLSISFYLIHISLTDRIRNWVENDEGRGGEKTNKRVFRAPFCSYHGPLSLRSVRKSFGPVLHDSRTKVRGVHGSLARICTHSHRPATICKHPPCWFHICRFGLHKNIIFNRARGESTKQYGVYPNRRYRRARDRLGLQLLRLVANNSRATLPSPRYPFSPAVSQTVSAPTKLPPSRLFASLLRAPEPLTCRNGNTMLRIGANSQMRELQTLHRWSYTPPDRSRTCHGCR